MRAAIYSKGAIIIHACPALLDRHRRGGNPW